MNENGMTYKSCERREGHLRNKGVVGWCGIGDGQEKGSASSSSG